MKKYIIVNKYANNNQIGGNDNIKIFRIKYFQN